MRSVLLCITLLAAALPPTLGQQVGPRSKVVQEIPGAVTGVVTDFQGAVIPEVKIEAKDRKGRIFETKSNSDGGYILSLPAGRYRLSFKSTFGLTPMVIADCQMPFSLTMHLDMSLPCDEPCKIVY